MEHFSAALKYYEQANLVDNMARIFEEYVRANFYQGQNLEALSFANMGLQILRGSNARLAGRFFLWKALLYNRLQKRDALNDAYWAAESLLGNRVSWIFKRLAPETLLEVERVERVLESQPLV